MVGRRFLAMLLGALMLLGTAAPAVAARHDGCARRIQLAERNLDQAIRRHGARSRQAQNRRRQLERARASCGAYRNNAFHGRW
jgi:hypothetical protein